MREELICDCLKLLGVGLVVAWFLFSVHNTSRSSGARLRCDPGMRIPVVCFNGARGR